MFHPKFVTCFWYRAVVIDLEIFIEGHCKKEQKSQQQN